ncbi:MAG: phosphatase domain-containing protein [Polyangiaceae bacterium]|jgi:hypothetical protein
MRAPLRPGLFATLATSALLSCAADVSPEDATSEDDATSWKAPAESSCEAQGMRDVANTASVKELDEAAKIERRAAENLVAGRPYTTIKAIDDVPLVGPKSLSALLAYAKATARVERACGPKRALGVVSDIDKTVAPEAKPDLSKAPYPGVKTLYSLLDTLGGDPPNDVVYVTARKPERVTEIPAYFTRHGVPTGTIETGLGGMPWVAEPEKVRDIEAVLARTGDKKFVFFGDTSQRDPEVYRTIASRHPARVAAILMHKVTAEVPPARVEGQKLHTSYAEAASFLLGLGILSRDEAKSVMLAAKEEGLALDDARMASLLDAPLR